MKFILCLLIILILIILCTITYNKEYFNNCDTCKKYKNKKKCNKCNTCIWCNINNECVYYKNYDRTKCLKNNIIKYNYKYNKIDKNKYNIYNYDDNCIIRCGDYKKCLLLKNKNNNYNKCLLCKKKKNKLFRNNITGFNCINKLKDNNSYNCSSASSFSCNNPNDLSNLNKVRPYYIIKKNSKGNECYFC